MANSTIIFSGSDYGLPIEIDSNSRDNPTVIHSVGDADTKDFIWLWLSVITDVGTPSITDPCYVKIVKQRLLTKVDDSLIYIPPGQKILVENGILLTENCIISAYKHISSTQRVMATGYVHRRIE